MTTIKNIDLSDSQEAREKSNKQSFLIFNWNDCIAETEHEYISRIRKKRLLNVMKEVIKNELDEQQRSVLMMRHFEKKSYAEIGRALFMSGSSALRCAQKAEDVVSSYMRYVVALADMDLRNEDKPLDVKMAIAQMLLDDASQEKISARLRKARTDKMISLHDAALCTGITEARIVVIENSGGAYITELKKLIAFYGVSADYIIFGAE